MTLLKKMMSNSGACPPRSRLGDVAMAWLGGLIAIAAVAYLAETAQIPLVLGSFGASCVLMFGFPDSPFSQPRNAIGGHVLASLIGLTFLSAFGAEWWSMALAAATAIAAMQLTRTVHPPAGSNPVIVMLTQPTWQFLLTPTLVGACVLVMVALFFNNMASGRQYPKYWY